MALGNGENNKKYINIKLVSDAGPIEEKGRGPKFVVLDENFNITGEEYTSIKGKLTWIKSTFTPKKGKMGDIYGFKAFIEDGDTVIVLESTITNASKDLLNSLLGARDQLVNISLYINKNRYPSSSVKDEGGNFVKGVLDFKTLTKEELKSAIDSTFVAEAKPSSGEIDLNDIPF